ncbi:YrhB domain-containing protein [Hahella ganghwensis]|uniref:YrhB domain-containing protein n=1 Tax=Hahella ganghwensis TaxID=286420 RepID=UPI00035DC582|nr:YrhB domain-containing protein [Hahella ganghwensis]
MNKQEAQSLVEAELERTKDKRNPVDCAVLPDETIERSWGWVFFYQSKAYIETGDFREMLGGNAPIIVNRDSGELIHTGTAYDIEHYIKEYEAAL